MADITLNDVSLRIKYGNKDDLPQSAPNGELLLAINTDGSRSLYCGTGSAVAPIINQGGSGTVYYEEYGEAEITLPTEGLTGITYEVLS